MRAAAPLVCLLIASLLLGCPASQPAQARAHSAASAKASQVAALEITPEIVGDEKFTTAVKDALELLREKSPEAYNIVAENVGRIKQSPHSGMAADEEPPTFELNDVSAYYSVTWCAGAIAHDSYHSKLYHDYKKAHGLPVPYDTWAGVPVEQQCNAHQLKTMQEIGAPDYEIDYMKTLDGTHADVNGDGKVDWDDKAQQNW